jgi:signal transduction histidine kinase
MEALKNFAKPYEPMQEKVDLGELLQRIIDSWRPKISRVGISQVVQIPEDFPKVKGDWRALEQVFTNLISNAIDAMSASGGTLSVRAETSALITNLPQVVVSVSDNGPGIPEEIRGRIFEPFVSTKATGTGLGLPITKRIVTAHRGNIQLTSFPGGTVFHVYLPACEDDQTCQ